MSTLRRLWRWFADFGSLFLIDHGFLRAVWSNRYRLAGGLYRANQPSPRMIRLYRRRFGIRTIINLRGENQEHGFYRLEEAACNREGVHLINIKTQSRGLMTVEALERLKEIIEAVEVPALAHCKSGADRAGFFAVLWRHWRLGEPIELAVTELDWRYGHFKSAKTGQLDSFFETYLRSRKPGQALIDWIREDYDPLSIHRNFRPKPWVRWFVDDFLRRE